LLLEIVPFEIGGVDEVLKALEKEFEDFINHVEIYRYIP
jgi:hypothetical protein